MASTQIKIKVIPRAKENKIIGWRHDVLHIRLAAAPTDGQANAALVKFLAKEWKIRQSQIEIIRGHSSREKVLSVPETFTK